MTALKLANIDFVTLLVSIASAAFNSHKKVYSSYDINQGPRHPTSVTVLQSTSSDLVYTKNCIRQPIGGAEDPSNTQIQMSGNPKSASNFESKQQVTDV